MAIHDHTDDGSTESTTDSGSEAESDAAPRTSPRSHAGSDAETRHYGAHKRQQTEQELDRERQRALRDALTNAHRDVVLDRYGVLARRLRDVLIPGLGIERKHLAGYDEYLSASGLSWHRGRLKRLLSNPDQWVQAGQAIANGNAPGSTVDRARLHVQGFKSGPEVVRETLEAALESVEAIAVMQGIVPGELQSKTPVWGYDLTLGRQYQPWEYNAPEGVRVVNPSIHPPFTLSIGLPGNGKSTALATLVEDAYQAGTKIIDILDFAELENGLYDVPSRAQDLRSKRAELNLPETFGDHPEYGEPDLEILAPKTERLCRASLPYDTEAEECVVRPFVVPISSIDDDTLLSMMDMTSTRETWLKRALDRVRHNNGENWSASDLKDEVIFLRNHGCKEGVIRRLYAEVSELEDKAWLATADHPQAIDWPRIFTETDVISVFSFSMIEQKRDKYRLLAILLEHIYDERMPDAPDVESDDDGSDSGDSEDSDEDEDDDPLDTSTYPRAMLVAREIQKIAPGDRKLKAASDEVQALRARLVGLMQDFSEERRHLALGILGDTQQWMQVNTGVRENVDRVLMFKQLPGIAKSVFSLLTGDEQHNHAQSVNDFSVGECAVIGSQWLDSGRPFEMTIEWAPPMCHVLDQEDDPSGWEIRVAYRPTEELRPSPFSIGGAGARDGTNGEGEGQGDAGLVDGDGNGDGGIDKREAVRKGPGPNAQQPGANRRAPKGFEAFLRECIRWTEDSSARVPMQFVREAYAAFAEDHDLPMPGSAAVFGQWMYDFYPLGEKGSEDGLIYKTRTTVAGDRIKAWAHLDMTDTGFEYLEVAPEKPFAQDTGGDGDRDDGDDAESHETDPDGDSGDSDAGDSEREGTDGPA